MSHGRRYERTIEEIYAHLPVHAFLPTLKDGNIDKPGKQHAFASSIARVLYILSPVTRLTHIERAASI